MEQAAGLEAQQRELSGTGCEKLSSEQVSSVAHRAALDAAIDYVRDGDTLMVTKPDRLARSVADLLGIVGRLEKKGVRLQVLSMGGSEVDGEEHAELALAQAQFAGVDVAVADGGLGEALALCRRLRIPG